MAEPGRAPRRRPSDSPAAGPRPAECVPLTGPPDPGYPHPNGPPGRRRWSDSSISLDDSVTEWTRSSEKAVSNTAPRASHPHEQELRPRRAPLTTIPSRRGPVRSWPYPDHRYLPPIPPVPGPSDSGRVFPTASCGSTDRRGGQPARRAAGRITPDHRPPGRCGAGNRPIPSSRQVPMAETTDGSEARRYRRVRSRAVPVRGDRRRRLPCRGGAGDRTATVRMSTSRIRAGETPLSNDTPWSSRSHRGGEPFPQGRAEEGTTTVSTKDASDNPTRSRRPDITGPAKHDGAPATTSGDHPHPACARTGIRGDRSARIHRHSGTPSTHDDSGDAAEARYPNAELTKRLHRERPRLSALTWHAETFDAPTGLDGHGSEKMLVRQPRGHGRSVDLRTALPARGAGVDTTTGTEQEIGIPARILTGSVPNPPTTLCGDTVTFEEAEVSPMRERRLVSVHAPCTAMDEVLEVRP